MIKFHCELCRKHQPINIDPIKKDKNYPKNGIWGDICCKVCNFVIATVSADEEGTYDFIKVADKGE